ncbi:SusC/RagA family TonB-linked outer membrane protein [Pedobacter nototheniae]|uniref:SusC/RagA family TonB-linked outer membrane protein n=1 Tax=Pedobacter nototheniae TaxID=2488994 RepID=UPI00103CC01D|nr:SusC/RagA family TonB-linked outer membrane protein [Pedobacter nototheniae]
MKKTKPNFYWSSTLRIFLFQLIIVLVFAQSVYAGKAKAQDLLDRQVSITATNMEIKQVLIEVQRQSKVKFMYSPNAIYTETKISLNEKNLKLKDLLDKIFSHKNILYKVIDQKILLYAADSVSVDTKPNAADRIIKGKVLDKTGSVLVGASIRVTGSKSGTFTDVNGQFSLTVSSSAASIEVSYVGYITQTVSLSDRELTITLLETEGNNLEVVVTALGITKDARKIGYATTKIDGSLLEKAKEPNIAYSLQGRVPGLNISGVSGGPGSSARILIRGISNFSSSTGPLFVIDGVPMDNTQKGSAGVYGGQDMGDGISSINPDDIENIVVLKGSTASALYGARASNGVILITTKSGKNQQGIGVEYNGNFSLNSMINYTDYQKAYGHGIKGVKPKEKGDLTAAGLNSWGAMLDGSPALSYDGQYYPYSPVENQQSDFYRIAPAFTNTVSILNGGEKGNFRFSLSHMNNQSILPNSGLTRYTANLNINHNITQKLKLSVMTNYIDEVAKLRTNLSDMSRNANFTMGLLPINIDPNYLKPGYDELGGYEWAMNADGYQANPWFVANKLISNTSRKRLISSVSLRYDVTKALFLQARGGYDLINDNVTKIEPTGIGYKRSGGIDELSKEQTQEMNADLLAGYTKKLSEKFTLDATFGGSIRKYNSDYLGNNGSNFKQPFLYILTNLETTGFNIKAPKAKQTNSAYYTADISFLNYITLSTTGRYDKFSTTNSGIFTPSVSTSFMFSRLINLPQLNFGKLRMSYAQTSGEADPYMTSVYYNVLGSNQNLGYGKMSDEVIPENVKPYRMKEFEIGTELKALNNRLSLDFTYFYRKTIGELIRKRISPSSGYLASYQPLGSTQNQGVEMMLSGTIIDKKDFSWKASINHTTVNNKLLKIDDTDNPAPLRKEGEGQYRPSVGPYSNGAYVASVQGLPMAQIMAYDYKYDASGNIVVGPGGIPMRGNLTPMGSGLPKHYGGLNNDFNYKKFNLSFLIDYKFGVKVLSATDFLSNYYGLNKETLVGRESGIIVKGVKEDGTPNDILVSAEDYYKSLMTNVASMSVFDGSFIKFRQITFGYTFTPKTPQKSLFRSINVSAVTRNLFTIMKHTKNFDPEASFSSLPGNAGLEGGGLPSTRMYGLNLNIKL